MALAITAAIGAEDVRDAARRIVPLALRTPVLECEIGDARVFLKCENLQRGGAFKIRGASNLILSLSPEQIRQGVVAFSSGNHAQAVAIAAAHVGARATIVMPEDAPRSKVEATRARGARIVTYDRFREDREEIARRILGEEGGTLVPPFDHPMIMAGQGTVALELIEDVGGLEALVVCAGGGGLLSGCATIAKAINPAIRVFGVEPDRADDIRQSLAKGERVTIPPPDTSADGLRTPSCGALAFPVIQRLVESVVVVSEEEIRAAMRFLIEKVKIVAEPSGAVTVAALLFGRIPAGLGRIGAVVSGGNVDFEFLRTL